MKKITMLKIAATALGACAISSDLAAAESARPTPTDEKHLAAVRQFADNVLAHGAGY